MTEDRLERLFRITESLNNPIKREYLSFTIDHNSVRTNGLLSEFLMGTVQNKETGEVKHFAIKLVPERGFIRNYGNVYKNEVHFYSVIFPKLKNFQKLKKVAEPFNNIPHYMYGQAIEDEEFIVMENLSPAGYRLPDRIGFLGETQLKMVFKIYAKFHALSFVYKSEYPEEFTAITSPLIDIMQYFRTKGVGKSMEDSYLAAIGCFDLELEADIIARLKKVESIREILGNSRSNHDGNYTCLIHGDCWLNNLLFKYLPTGELEDAKLIDFQLTYVSTPVHDLSYFFYSGAAKPDMDRINYYLEFYYHHFSSFVRELGANPQEIYPYTALKEEWKKYSLIGIIIGIGMWVGKLMDKDEIISLIDRKNLPSENYYELWNAKMSKVRRGNAFRQRARDLCLHAIEYGIL